METNLFAQGNSRGFSSRFFSLFVAFHRLLLFRGYDLRVPLPKVLSSLALVAAITLGCKVKIGDSGDKLEVSTAKGHASPVVALSLLNPDRVGPIDPTNGFPFWYADQPANGIPSTKLDRCIDPPNAATPRCPGPPGPPQFDPTQPVVFPSNWPLEVFYFDAVNSMTVPIPTLPTPTTPKAATSLLAQFALESTFSTLDPIPGKQIVFQRIRFLGSNFPVGRYRIVHPYGEDIFDVTAVGPRNINFLQDIAPIDGDFFISTSGRITSFLRWPNVAGNLPPAGFIGNPVTQHVVTGSPTGNNFVAVDQATPQGWSRLATNNLFSVAGKVSTLSVVSDKVGGTYFTLPTPALFASDPNAKVYFTLDGSDPKVAGATWYNDPASLLKNVDLEAYLAAHPAPTLSLRAVATNDNGATFSPELKLDFTKSVTKLEVIPSLAQGRYQTDLISVTLTSLGPVEKISYTTNDTDPATSASRNTYTAGTLIDFVGNGVKVLRFIGTNAAGGASQSYRVVYNLERQFLAVGLENIATRFPYWYQDKQNGVTLEPCLDFTNGSHCPAPTANVNPALPASFPTNFPEEFFYYNAIATANVTNIDGTTGTVIGQFAVEGAFLPAVIIPANRVTFARIRLNGSNLFPGRYRITYPYGVRYFDVTAVGRASFADTSNVVGGPPTFDGATIGAVGPFLTWDPAVGDVPPDPAYIADATILHKVVGSPFGTNFLKVDFIDANGEQTVGLTDLFTIAGKKAVLTVGAGPQGGLFKVAPIIKLDCSEPGAPIYYEKNLVGPAVPTTASPVFPGAITLLPNETQANFKAVCIVDQKDAAGNIIATLSSNVISETYVVDNVTPVVTVATRYADNLNTVLASTLTQYAGPVSVTLLANEVARIYYSIDGSAPDPTSPATFTYSGPIPLNSPTKTLNYCAVDPAGNTNCAPVGPVSTKVFTFLTTPPIVTAPVVSFVPLTLNGAATVPVNVSTGTIGLKIDWTGTATSAPICGYTVQKSIGVGAFTSIQIAPNLATPAVACPATTPATTRNDSAIPFSNVSYRYQVQASDTGAVKNISPFAVSKAYNLSVFNEKDKATVDKNLILTGRWTAGKPLSALGGGTVASTVVNDTATFTFAGNGIAYVAGLAPTNGVAAVSIDGGPETTVSLASATAVGGRAVFLKSGLTQGTHRIKVRVASGRVEVDAFIVLN